jgi:glycosyltransferase involved in cell wall biosynthesis
MKVCMKQFFGACHSWSIVGQNIARSLIKQGHTVDLFSTNGNKYFPEDLRPNLIGYVDEKNAIVGSNPGNDYEMSVSFTALKNMGSYLGHSPKNRFGIWCYEFAGKNALPNGFAKCYKDCDRLLPPSSFAKQVFLDSGIPSSAMTVIPHGINFDEVDAAIPYELKTKKNTKILVVIGQVHRRKNLQGLLDMYGKAFTNKDDVCLVLKVQDRPPTQPFELSFGEIYHTFHDRYKSHAEVEIIREFIPNMFSLYKVCDIVFTATFCEAFYIPGLESNALGLINIAPNYGGQVDFLNNDNSLLIDGKEFFVPIDHLYWHRKPGTIAFAPHIDDGIDKLRHAVENKSALLAKFKSNIDIIRSKYNWDTITSQILNLCE